MTARERRRAMGLAVAGGVLVLAGTWLTLLSVGAWMLEYVMPREVLSTVVHALLVVAGELVVRAWPLGLMALGAMLLVHGAVAPRWAPARGRDGR